MKRIFISYRRSDGTPWASQIASTLKNAVTTQQLSVFFDSSSTALGDDYRCTAMDVAGQASLLISVISPEWPGLLNNGRRRIDDPEDLVRCELLSSYGECVKVVPVFVNGADWTDIEPIPDDLAWLRQLHASSIRRDEISADVNLLVNRLLDDLGLTTPGISNDRTSRTNIEIGTINAGSHSEFHFGGDL